MDTSGALGDLPPLRNTEPLCFLLVLQANTTVMCSGVLCQSYSRWSTVILRETMGQEPPVHALFDYRLLFSS